MSKSRQILPKPLTVVVGYDGVQILDIAGPVQAFTTANEEGAGSRYDVSLISPAGGPVKTASGLDLLTRRAPRVESIDTLIVPGGPGIHALIADPAGLALIRRLSSKARRICAVCTGAFALAELGLLDGRRAVTHWRSCMQLASTYPAIEVDPDPIFIRSGDIWTTAGVTAGIDLALSLIEDDCGAGVAARVARRLVVYMRREGGQRQFSSALAIQTTSADPYATLLANIAEAPARDWNIEAMARAAAQTPRTFHRKFSGATGVTPAEAVDLIRCDLARTLLATTPLGLGQIATRCGFSSEGTLRRALQRRFGVSPVRLRRGFASGKRPGARVSVAMATARR
jgi:transcriptional regulator GlxA family with amidase domain